MVICSLKIFLSLFIVYMYIPQMIVLIGENAQMQPLTNQTP